MDNNNNYKCGHCGYEGPCYGTPTSKGVSAPWCKRCGMNNKLTKINETLASNKTKAGVK